MRILYLPGNTANHKEWVDKLAKDTDISLEKDILHYKHWETGDQIINFDTELERLRDLVKDDEYIVVGKSAGCALGLMAYKQKIVNAKRFIFLGFPYLWLEKLGIDPKELLSNIDKPVLFLQKPHDPVIGLCDLKERIVDMNNLFTFLEYKREGEADDNHGYDDTKYIGDILVKESYSN